MVRLSEVEDQMHDCEHSNKSYLAILSSGAVYYALILTLNFELRHSREMTVNSCKLLAVFTFT